MAGPTAASADRQAATTAAARQVLADHYSDDKNSELFGVTELCNAFDVTPRTLRFYEDKGLLSRAASTARAFTAGATAPGWR